MMAALELAQAHAEGRAIWGPVLAFAHGQGDKMCEEPYKFPCAKDGSFGTYAYYMHAERLYDNVYDVLTFYNKWTHVEAPSCHPVPQGTVSLTVEQQNVDLRNRVVRSEADRQGMPEGTQLAVYNANNLQLCPWVYVDEDELPVTLSDESLFPTADGCGEACWISSTGEFMYSRETPYYTLRTSGRGQVRSGYWRSESRDKSFGRPRRIQTNLFGGGGGGREGAPESWKPRGLQTQGIPDPPVFLALQQVHPEEAYPRHCHDDAPRHRHAGWARRLPFLRCQAGAGRRCRILPHVPCQRRHHGEALRRVQVPVLVHAEGSVAPRRCANPSEHASVLLHGVPWQLGHRHEGRKLRGLPEAVQQGVADRHEGG